MCIFISLMLNLGRVPEVISTLMYIQFCEPKDVTRYCHNTSASRNFLGASVGTTLHHSVGNHACMSHKRGWVVQGSPQSYRHGQPSNIASCRHFCATTSVTPSEKCSGHPMLRSSILHKNIGFMGTKQSGKA